jgi:hypothetical protein
MKGYFDDWRPHSAGSEAERPRRDWSRSVPRSDAIALLAGAPHRRRCAAIQAVPSWRSMSQYALAFRRFLGAERPTLRQRFAQSLCHPPGTLLESAWRLPKSRTSIEPGTGCASPNRSMATLRVILWVVLRRLPVRFVGVPPDPKLSRAHPDPAQAQDYSPAQRESRRCRTVAEWVPDEGSLALLWTGFPTVACTGSTRSTHPL